MAITSTPCIKDSRLAARGKVVLTQVPDNIRILEQKKCTFRCREQDASHMVDWFGRNTWDASCTRVDPVGMDDGIKDCRLAYAWHAMLAWKNGVEIIDPSNIYDFYNYYHSYPVSCGVDGVKVDVQNGQEMLSATTLIENFQSDHYTAEFYAAARALGGCHEPSIAKGEDFGFQYKVLYMSHPSPLDIDSVEEFQGENLRGRLCSICIQFRQAFKLLPEGLADIQFAPIGLVDMYNSGGALEALSCINDSSGCTINAKV
ncbi:hypothetical protein WN944_013325 [Citrus x changshan-huyou]|uniref:Uncharacterized protein n=1 Tax=Citrus x changshan-huyou TaxID=2935761 RepID=A0AAP0QNY1_9ROSI